MKTLGDVGEFALIDRIAALVGSGSAVVGIGDDAAVLEYDSDTYLLATTDMLVSGVHFHTSARAFDLGRRAIAVNCSDIAAMGGRPKYALVSIAAPLETSVAYVEEMYRGAVDAATVFSMTIVGGNLTRIANNLVIDVTVLGSVPRGEVVLRSGAMPGDVLAVTGELGRSAAVRLRPDAPKDKSAIAQEPEPPYVPSPRVAEARELASRHLVHAMMDVSDGLAGDIQHLVRSSAVGAVIRIADVPVALNAREVATALGIDYSRFGLEGGEDYELLMALPQHAVPGAQEAVAPTPLTVIGTILEAGEGVVVETAEGHREPLSLSGWSHF